ncbi:MAG: winged helix-turn-helix transcriptional regulator [Chlorobi bacterium]|nr:MAG: transcriptional regulator [Chlorobi bacterium OLB7]MBK8910028.1 winged helix-turn-helix transcriptional regulator [Chlorobiota bacterium]MBX7217478.1 metalloregulator ArsR/SmtB family transcription factor [Candidatus Kapabacteria bacterium]
MPRAPTTSDAFNAVAEPQRRAIIALLAQGEKSVNQIAEMLGMNQPQASKHLKVLKEVGLVTVRGAGQQRLYSLNGKELKPIYDWITTYERFWSESFDRLEEYLHQLQREEKK